MKNHYPHRFEIYSICLDLLHHAGPATDKKWQPALVLSNDIANRCSKHILVAPLSSSIERIHPFEAKIKIAGEFQKVLLDQIRSIDKRRLRSCLCVITSLEMVEVEKALKLALALP